MTKNSLLIVFLVAFLMLTALPLASNAAEKKQSEYTVLAAEEQVDGDYVTGGEIIDLSGTVLGDSMLLGGQLDVLGEVRGDLLGIGGNIEVTGLIAQNVRLVGGNIRINGEVGRNISLAGGNIQFNENAIVSGNTYAAGGNITTRATHQGKVSFVGGAVIINGVVEGDVEVYADSVIVREQARITGTLTYYSDRDAQISDGAVIGGAITKSAPKTKMDFPFRFGTKSKLLFALWKLASALLLVLVLWKLFKTKIVDLLQTHNQDFWKKLGWGLVALIATPIACVIALITIVGIPLGFIGLMLYAILLYVASVLGATLLGHFLLNLLKAGQGINRFPWLAVMVGVIVVFVVSTVPVIGFLLALILLLWALGSFVLVLKK